MTVTANHSYPLLHPVHAILLAGSLPLFLGALLSDIAYATSYQIQWNNFSSWMIAGGLVFAALALLCAVIDRFRAQGETPPLIYPLLLLLTWILGFINALIHARDAWASMPAGLVLSVIVTLLTAATIWVGFCGLRAGGAK